MSLTKNEFIDEKNEFNQSFDYLKKIVSKLLAISEEHEDLLEILKEFDKECYYIYLKCLSEHKTNERLNNDISERDHEIDILKRENDNLNQNYADLLAKFTNLRDDYLEAVETLKEEQKELDEDNKKMMEIMTADLNIKEYDNFYKTEDFAKREREILVLNQLLIECRNRIMEAESIEKKVPLHKLVNAQPEKFAAFLEKLSIPFEMSNVQEFCSLFEAISEERNEISSFFTASEINYKDYSVEELEKLCENNFPEFKTEKGIFRCIALMAQD